MSKIEKWRDKWVSHDEWVAEEKYKEEQHKKIMDEEAYKFLYKITYKRLENALKILKDNKLWK